MFVKIYFDFKEQRAQTATNIAANVLKQLVQDSLHDKSCADILETIDDRLERGRLGGLRELTDFIGQWLERIEVDTYFVFDALDECENTSTQQQILNFLRQLARVGVRILVTSRQPPPDSFPAQKITIRAHNVDIETFVRFRFESRRISPSLLDEIVRAVVSRAQGM